jgi:hypothetical protein
MTIHNAKITSTFLGMEDHGIMTFFVHLEWPGAGIGYGGYGLDGYSGEGKPRLGSGHGYQAIRHIIETIGAKSWEDLKNKLCRIDFDDGPGISGKISRIGHIMEEKWFDLASYMRDDPT